MALRGYLIPPSSHFLKSLANFCIEKLSLDRPSVSQHYIVFPSKRASLFFRFYLVEKLNQKSFFLPKVLSWEEFLQELYAFSSGRPFQLFPDSGKILLLLPVLRELGIYWKEPEKLLFWGSKFLEVFEEFEKEGRVPENLYYPPEELPEQAKSFFEKLARAYELFTQSREREKILFPSDLLSAILRDHQLIDRFLASLKGIFFAGFVAFRRAELEIIKLLISKLRAEALEPLFFFEDNSPPHSLIQRTAEELDCELSLLDEKFLEASGTTNHIEILSFPDPESEVACLRNLVSEIPPRRPDDLAVILPDPTILQALIRRIADLPLEVNITLPFKAKFLPINNLLQQILRAQRERVDGRYPLPSILKVISNPLLGALFPEQRGSLTRLKEALEQNLRTPERVTLSIEELEGILDLPLRSLFKKLADPLFLIWETANSPQSLSRALQTFLEFIKPLTEGEDFLSTLNRLYWAEISKKILPIFVESTLWREDFTHDQSFLLRFLETLLRELELPLYGDPLAGLQIMGFLESRLLGFKNIIIFDTNEGSLPPRPAINPLLTDEMKILLKLPIHRNEIWDYYFRNLICSGENIKLFYVKAVKGALAEEPSRFLQRLLWEAERGIIEVKQDLFSWQIYSLKSRDALEKTDDDRTLILELLKNWEISRYLLETYLLCPVRFYLKYLLSLDDGSEEFREDLEIGNFLHKFFECFLRSLTESERVSFQQVAKTRWWCNLFESLWEEMRPDRNFDPLSAYLSRKIAQTAVERYIDYLANLEIEGKLTESSILGTEVKLKSTLSVAEDLSSVLGIPSLTLSGRIDFLLKRVFQNSEIQHIAFDFKTNPDKEIASRKVNSFTKSIPPDDFRSKESLIKVRDLFASNLNNFQPLFYFYLLWNDLHKELSQNHNRTLSPNAGYITPTNFEKPESSLLPFPTISKGSSRSYVSNYRMAMELAKKMEVFLIWIIKHMVFSEAFYFAEEKNCVYCSYKMPCRSLRRG